MLFILLRWCLYDPAHRGLVYLRLTPKADFAQSFPTRVNPRLLGASIDHVRINVVIYSDACTTVGAGSYRLVADSNEYSHNHKLRGELLEGDILVSDHVIRWLLKSPE